MPVTKKKGAIFAIYADSPVASNEAGTSQSVVSPTKRSLRQASSTLKSHPKSNSTLPPLSGSTGRKALSALQASAVKPQIGFSSVQPSDDKVNASAIDKPKVPINPKQSTTTTAISTSTNTTTTTTASSLKPSGSIRKSGSSKKTTASATSKRQFDAFPSPPDTAVSTFPQPDLPSQLGDKSASVVRFKENAASNASKSYESPMKRGKLSTPSSSTRDKENVAPSVLDSPASRTRSKTRRQAGSISSLSALGIHSPVQTLRPKNLRTDSENSENALSRAQCLVGPEMVGVRDETVLELRGLVGNGRGALSLKKGRALAGILGAGVDLGDAVEDHLGLTESHAGKSSKGRSEGKARWVAGDQPLADVSEAYGAAGEAPEGFAIQ
ncbi:hypothetical protein BD324DRAFT_614779 [Kockovaella imperatae]|uniref:Uncharacterized protein n=1 Tax=Kockovaella imperatae TaxID=4999 RepID=A0A1Y1UNX1_9TREE|nr:hypothetical protein BD324DRAFT_614779 [Kockovaella imperatae]ORX39733.1 hypothetical protein BD324DRAFT_614779 [Kockovaella imperatae]